MADAYRIGFSRAAQERLGALNVEERSRLEEMLREIGAEASVFAAGRGAGWAAVRPLGHELLTLEVGRATIRYAIDTQARSIRVQHVLLARPKPFAVSWAPGAADQLAAVHPDIRGHIVRQIEQVAALAGTEAVLLNAYRQKPPRDVTWTFEGHTVYYTLDHGSFQLTVVQVQVPGNRSAG